MFDLVRCNTPAKGQSVNYHLPQGDRYTQVEDSSFMNHSVQIPTEFNVLVTHYDPVQGCQMWKGPVFKLERKIDSVGDSRPVDQCLSNSYSFTHSVPSVPSICSGHLGPPPDTHAHHFSVSRGECVDYAL